MARQRRYFSDQFKLQVVQELLSGTATQAQLARRYDLSPHLILQWRKGNPYDNPMARASSRR